MNTYELNKLKRSVVTKAWLAEKLRICKGEGMRDWAVIQQDDILKYNIESAENGKVNIHVYNFKSSFATGLKKAQAIAKYNGRMISIVFFVTLLPEANPILDYSLYMEV